MLNNDQNNKLSWQQRLNEMEVIPGEPLQDKKQAWGKLQSRLEEKPAGKKKFFYWAAAAAILLACMIPWMISEKKAASIDQAQHIDQKNKPGIINTKKENKAIAKSTQASITIQPKKTANTPSPTKNIINTAVTEKNNNTAFENPVEIIEPEITTTNSIPILDTAKAIAVAAKKKLPIVHINELNNGNQLSTTNNVLDNFKRFIRPSNKDVSIETPGNSRFNGDHIIIQHVNPQNQN